MGAGAGGAIPGSTGRELPFHLQEQKGPAKKGGQNLSPPALIEYP